jgi:hypothetical protein
MRGELLAEGFGKRDHGRLGRAASRGLWVTLFAGDRAYIDDPSIVGLDHTGHDRTAAVERSDQAHIHYVAKSIGRIFSGGRIWPDDRCIVDEHQSFRTECTLLKRIFPPT